MKNSEIIIHRRYLTDLREHETQLVERVEEQKINGRTRRQGSRKRSARA